MTGEMHAAAAAAARIMFTSVFTNCNDFTIHRHGSARLCIVALDGCLYVAFYWSGGLPHPSPVTHCDSHPDTFNERRCSIRVERECSILFVVDCSTGLGSHHEQEGKNGIGYWITFAAG